MAMHKMATEAARIGKLAGEILMHAIPMEVLGITGANKQMPKNKSAVIVFRRWLPLGDVDNIWITSANVDTYETSLTLTEGVLPTANDIEPVDVTATLKQYGILYSLSDQVADLYEDDVAAEMKVQTGQAMGLLREMVRYGVLKGATNKYYAGGTNRATVSTSITLTLLRNVTRTLMRNHAQRITRVLSSSGNYGTEAVEAGYLVFCSTDMEPAIRDLTGFTNTKDYGARQVINENEIGAVERFRFILSPELAGYASAGEVVGSAPGMLSSDDTNIDVYPVIVCGEDAWGQVALRGSDAMKVSYLKPNSMNHATPLGQVGYIGAKCYHTAVILNQGRMAVIEAGVPSLA